jgi:hypothetical protein
MKIFIHYVESNRLFRINILKHQSYSSLKKKIIKLGLKKQIFVENLVNIKIRYINNYLSSKSNITFEKNTVLYVSLNTKLKGGDEKCSNANVANNSLLYVTPSAMFFIIIILTIVPILYILLLYGGIYSLYDVIIALKTFSFTFPHKIKHIKNMIDDDSSLFSYNNYYIRKSLDEPAYIDIINKGYYIIKYLKKDLELYRSTLYLIFYMLYATYITFTINLYFIIYFVKNYTINSTKCFIHGNTAPILAFGTSISIVVPIILIILGWAGFKLSIFTYLITLFVANICIYTSVYWNKTQKLETALKYNDPTIPGNDPSLYTADNINYMPNYFRNLYWIPLIVILVTLFSYYMHIHPLMWGVLCAFLGSLPSYYVLINEIPLYCSNTPYCSKSFDHISQIFKTYPVSQLNNLRKKDPYNNNLPFYYNFK